MPYKRYLAVYVAIRTAVFSRRAVTSGDRTAVHGRQYRAAVGPAFTDVRHIKTGTLGVVHTLCLVEKAFVCWKRKVETGYIWSTSVRNIFKLLTVSIRNLKVAIVCDLTSKLSVKATLPGSDVQYSNVSKVLHGRC